MKPPDENLTKGQAVAYISMMTGYGMPTVERTLKRLQDEKRIAPTKTAYAILFSPADVETVIKVLKGEIK